MVSPKLQLTCFAFLVFLIVGSPTLYSFTDARIASPFGLDFVDDDGNVTTAGLVTHALVAAVLVNIYLMTFHF
jgi:hypothetical protein